MSVARFDIKMKLAWMFFKTINLMLLKYGRRDFQPSMARSQISDQNALAKKCKSVLERRYWTPEVW